MGHYPAIDIEKSISRIMNNIVSKEHITAAQKFRAIYSKYEENRDVIQLGIYKKGADQELDLAIDLRSRLMQFLAQDIDDRSEFGNSIDELAASLGE